MKLSKRGHRRYGMTAGGTGYEVRGEEDVSRVRWHLYAGGQYVSSHDLLRDAKRVAVSMARERILMNQQQGD